MTETRPATTRGEAMLALRKARMAAAPPFLRGGFRPFFFGGAAWAVVALLLWLMAFTGRLELPSGFAALAWHRHEMLFGFIGAVITGFLLTAIPNWTGRLPIAGPPLAALAAWWLAARLAVLASAATGLVAAMVLDVGFYLVLALVAGREVVAAKNRNVPIVGLVVLFAVANAADYLAAFGLVPDSEAGFRSGIALVVLMISLIGGRTVPSFTRNWMTKRGFTRRLPTQPDKFDALVLAATALALAAWTLFPWARLAGIALVIVGALQAARLARWGGWRTVRDPLVLVLHIGYAWIPIGLVLLGWSILGTALPRTAAIHALTAGAMATMILAMMTRASLGHTGRPLVASAATVAMFVLVTVGAVLRVAVSLGSTDYRIGLELAGASWGGAFALFLAVYAPVLFGSPPSGPASA
jgi:uncharacterized protein involved in response to NO